MNTATFKSDAEVNNLKTYESSAETTGIDQNSPETSSDDDADITKTAADIDSKVASNSEPVFQDEIDGGTFFSMNSSKSLEITRESSEMNSEDSMNEVNESDLSVPTDKGLSIPVSLEQDRTRKLDSELEEFDILKTGSQKTTDDFPANTLKTTIGNGIVLPSALDKVVIQEEYDDVVKTFSTTTNSNDEQDATNEMDHISEETNLPDDDENNVKGDDFVGRHEEFEDFVVREELIEEPCDDDCDTTKYDNLEEHHDYSHSNNDYSPPHSYESSRDFDLFDDLDSEKEFFDHSDHESERDNILQTSLCADRDEEDDDDDEFNGDEINFPEPDEEQWHGYF